MNPTSLFELMQSSTVVDRMQQDPTPAAQSQTFVLFPDDVYCFFMYQEEITRLGKKYKFTGYKDVSPLNRELYRNLREAHRKQKGRLEIAVDLSRPRQIAEVIRDANAYMSNIKAFKNSSQPKVRHIDEVQNYLHKTDCQLERLVKMIQKSIA